MSSRLIIALIIMLLAPGVQAHNFVTGKTVTPVYIGGRRQAASE